MSTPPPGWFAPEAAADRPLHVADGPVPCLDPYGVRIDLATVVSVADRVSGAVVAIAA